jgi:hypothetical protein
VFCLVDCTGNTRVAATNTEGGLLMLSRVGGCLGTGNDLGSSPSASQMSGMTKKGEVIFC